MALIDGYDEDPLVIGEELLELPGFWAAYLMWLCETEADEEPPTPALFGVDEAEHDAAFEALHAFERWPVFRIPLEDGHITLVLCRNLADDEGLEFHVAHPQWDRQRHLASVEGHWAGPGLAWPELLHIASHHGPDAEGVHDAGARLLLLLPALGDVDTPPEAAEVVAAALVAASVPEQIAPETASRMLTDPPFWGPALWQAPAATGLLVCDDHHSPRCGLDFVRGLTAGQRKRLARAFGT